jgi:hypothetical protein
MFLSKFISIDISKMRSILILAALGAAYVSLTSAQQQQLQQQGPIMVDGVIEGDESILGDQAMVESIKPPKANSPVSINAPQPTAAAPPVIPISAMLYSSSPGPKVCRGTPIFGLNLPKQGTPAGPTCYNMPSTASCGTFMANMEDGCQARLFAESNCLSFVNLAVFLPELRPAGGSFRSIEITCGIKNVQPGSMNLNLPPVEKPVQ